MRPSDKKMYRQPVLESPDFFTNSRLIYSSRKHVGYTSLANKFVTINLISNFPARFLTRKTKFSLRVALTSARKVCAYSVILYIFMHQKNMIATKE